MSNKNQNQKVEEELKNQINYIHYNPVKHGLVDNVRDWKYSSFHKFVKEGLYENNWGCFEDIKNIKDLDFEQFLSVLLVIN